jgi:tRNA (mo5U34)-methyltransferase
MATTQTNVIAYEAAKPAPDGKELARRVAELGEWFHNIDLNGVMTAPHHFLGDFPRVKWKQIAAGIPQDLSGAAVLDIGCNAGFYCLELKKRGASRVLGVDVDDRYLQQARFAAGVLGLEI